MSSSLLQALKISINQEKVVIARKYLIPKSLARSGLQKADIKYKKQALLSEGLFLILISAFCSPLRARDFGMRYFLAITTFSWLISDFVRTEYIQYDDDFSTNLKKYFENVLGYKICQALAR